MGGGGGVWGCHSLPLSGGESSSSLFDKNNAEIADLQVGETFWLPTLPHLYLKPG